MRMVSDGHHHDGVQNFESSLDRRRMLVEVRLCTCVEKVWSFDDYLMTLSPKMVASHAVGVAVLGPKA